MFALGIETSCDETAAAVVRDGREILSNVIASQLDLHAEYGGVVPELACRKHIQVIDGIVERALAESGLGLAEIDLISVVRGPGLIGALLIGVNYAKGLAWGQGLPLVPVNHVEAHVYGSAMSNPQMEFPAVGLVASGGHTSLFVIENLGKYRRLGETTDDAVGESFDKVASLLGLPYVGGPEVEKLALKGDPNVIRFPRGLTKKRSYNFSYSGLKTAVLYHVKGYGKTKRDRDRISEKERADVAASFQEAALDVLVQKAVRAAEEFRARSIAVGGGVAANRRLRELFHGCAAKLGVAVHFPAPELCTDNAAMVAGLGHRLYTKDASAATYDFDAEANADFFQ
ncbi:tRNA (adenosine(37)-N6)-threonylcarbamoyltransferase complex transferase subunit TsaD [bacterium]|nr:tRNA (adenosine(37)-N6)-threonylcarbamoyltransferase complex transferase subunit TsaD [bacterium]